MRGEGEATTGSVWFLQRGASTCGPGCRAVRRAPGARGSDSSPEASMSEQEERAPLPEEGTGESDAPLPGGGVANGPGDDGGSRAGRGVSPVAPAREEGLSGVRLPSPPLGVWRSGVQGGPVSPIGTAPASTAPPAETSKGRRAPGGRLCDRRRRCSESAD